MRITKKSGYGLIAIVKLADNYGLEPVSTRELSEKYDLPRPFLEKILRKLKGEELVEVKRGRNGGYMLFRKPSEISLKEVVGTLENGNTAPVSCLLSGEKGNCHLKNRCPTEEVWEEVNEKIDSILKSINLSDLI